MGLVRRTLDRIVATRPIHSVRRTENTNMRFLYLIFLFPSLPCVSILRFPSDSTRNFARKDSERGRNVHVHVLSSHRFGMAKSNRRTVLLSSSFFYRRNKTKWKETMHETLSNSNETFRRIPGTSVFTKPRDGRSHHESCADAMDPIGRSSRATQQKGSHVP